jgi:hypothetical protein
MASSLRVNAIVPASGTNVAIGTAGGTITYTASVSGVSTFSNGIIVSAGSTSAPSISPSGDSNTGIFFPSADTIAFGEGGSESARFDSNGRLGIGTQIPSAVINVRSSSAELARFTNTGSNGGDWEIKLGGGGFEDRKFMLTDRFGGTDNVRVFVDSSGRVTKPYQPAFFATGNSSTITVAVGSYFPFNTLNTTFANSNRNSGYNTSTYLYTAPVTGLYQFYIQLYLNPNSTTNSITWWKNGTQLDYIDAAINIFMSTNSSTTPANIMLNGSVILELSANDTVGIKPRTGNPSGINVYMGHSSFWGYLIG